MKNMLLVLFAMATTMMMHAQSFTAQKVSAESVPQVVRDAQAADFLKQPLPCGKSKPKQA